MTFVVKKGLENQGPGREKRNFRRHHPLGVRCRGLAPPAQGRGRPPPCPPASGRCAARFTPAPNRRKRSTRSARCRPAHTRPTRAAEVIDPLRRPCRPSPPGGNTCGPAEVLCFCQVQASTREGSNGLPVRHTAKAMCNSLRAKTTKASVVLSPRSRSLRYVGAKVLV